MLKKLSCISIAVLLVSASLAPTTASFAADRIIAVQAPRGALTAKKKWTELAKYLSAETGDKYRLRPVTPSAAKDFADSGDIDFALINPVVAASILKSGENVQMLGLIKKSGDSFGGTILSKAGSGIKIAADLKGKKVISFKIGKSAGAYVFQMYHLKQAGISKADFASMRDAKKQDDGVIAVKAGGADVAFIRTGILENMVKEGKVKTEDFIVVDKVNDNFPLVHSTALYPEWQLIAVKAGKGMGDIDKVKAALLKLAPDSAVSKKAKIKGFTDPTSLDGLIAVLKDMKIKPFNE